MLQIQICRPRGMSCPLTQPSPTRRGRITIMAGPKEIETRIRTTISGWESLTPTKSFAGMTLDQFKTAVAPSLVARETIANLENQMTLAKNQRDTADEASLTKVQAVVLSVLADPAEGPDG